MKLNEKIIEECYKIINKDSDRSTWKVLAEEYSFIDGESLRQKFKSYRKKNGNLPSIDETILKKHGYIGENSKPYKESVQMNKDGSQVSDRKIEVTAEEEDKLKDQDYMIEKHGFDKNKWEIDNCKNTFWDTQLKGGKITKLYASKITLKPRKNYVWSKEKVKELFNSLYEEPRRKINLVSKKNDNSDKLLFVRLSDFHYNLKSDMLTTGNDYNIELAEEYFYYILEQVYNQFKDDNFEKILFIIGDDFINADNIQGTTTRGTPQDNDVSWEKAVLGATRLIRDAIECLVEIAPVDVINIQSNHDQHTMFGIAETLKARYEDCDCVNVINNPVPNQYYKYGKNLLCLAHDMPPKKVLEIVSDQAKEYWTECEHVICILAHLHNHMQYERQGRVEIFRMPTISGWSRWANGKNFSHAEKRADIYIIDKNNGIVDKKIIAILDKK